MSGFDDFVDKAGEIAAKAAEKAKDLAAVAAEKAREVSRVAKLNMDISAKRDVMKKAYGELGKLYFESHGTAPEEPFAQVCQEIELARTAIAEMEEEIARIKADAEKNGIAEAADFEAVVDATAEDAEVEVEITVEQPGPAGEPAEEAPEPPAADGDPAQDPDQEA